MLRLVTLGDIILYDGRPHAFRGHAPIGVRVAYAELEDLVTGEWRSVPLDELPPLDESGEEEATGEGLVSPGSVR